MRFDWDPNKAASNRKKHGVSFEEAALTFDDPFALRAKDAKHSTPAEARMLHIGETPTRGVLVVVFTIRSFAEEAIFRIISARKASRKERMLYEINQRIPIS